jgi:hypothetical protein
MVVVVGCSRGSLALLLLFWCIFVAPRLRWMLRLLVDRCCCWVWLPCTCTPFSSFLCSQVHPENDPEGKGLDQAKAYTVATGGHHAGVLHSSFVSEVKSDLMGEQTILCGMLQTGAVLSFDKMVSQGIDPGYASKLVQYGWETITEALKHGGITGARVVVVGGGGGVVVVVVVVFG